MIWVLDTAAVWSALGIYLYRAEIARAWRQHHLRQARRRQA